MIAPGLSAMVANKTEKNHLLLKATMNTLKEAWVGIPQQLLQGQKTEPSTGKCQVPSAHSTSESAVVRRKVNSSLQCCNTMHGGASAKRQRWMKRKRVMVRAITAKAEGLKYYQVDLNKCSGGVH